MGEPCSRGGSDMFMGGAIGVDLIANGPGRFAGVILSLGVTWRPGYVRLSAHHVVTLYDRRQNVGHTSPIVNIVSLQSVIYDSFFAE